MDRLFSRRAFLTVIAFFAVTLLLYGWSLKNPFVRWDDGLLVYENPAVREITPRSVKHIFTTYDPELYIPLTFLSYQIDYQLGHGSTFPYHLGNLILHTLNAMFVGLLFFYLWGKRGAINSSLLTANRSSLIALFAGLLFLVHPLHTEAALWVSARKDVLSTFFFLLSLVTYLRWRETDQKKTYVISILAFTLGLLSKVMVITLPVVLLLLDWREGRKWSLVLLKEKIPYFALSLIFGVIALGGKQAVLESSTLSAKILMAFKSSAFYLQKIVWPTNLSLLYPYTKPISVTSPDFFVPILLVIGLLIGAWMLCNRSRDLLFGLLFFFLTVAPTFLNFAKGDELDIYFASDRYAYIPSIGIIFGVLTLLLAFPFGQRNFQFSIFNSQFSFKTLISAFLSMGTLVFALLAYNQSLVWTNTETLFENVLRTYPESSHVAHNNLGNAYRLRGELDRAIGEYEAAIKIKPTARAFSNLGAAYRKQGKFDLALAQYEKALKLDAKSKEAHFGLGLVLEAEGKMTEAQAKYEQALTIDPLYEEAHTNLGSILLKQGKTDDAITAYQKALTVNPFFPDAQYNLAIALTSAGRSDEAITAYERTVSLVPAFIPAHINLGILLFKTGQREEARRQFQEILTIDPGNATARKALTQMGNE